MEKHVMIITDVDDDGAETWACLSCKRTFIMRSWSPFIREILHPGDDVPHSGYFAERKVEIVEPPYWWTLD